MAFWKAGDCIRSTAAQRLSFSGRLVVSPDLLWNPRTRSQEPGSSVPRLPDYTLVRLCNRCAFCSIMDVWPGVRSQSGWAFHTADPIRRGEPCRTQEGHNRWGHSLRPLVGWPFLRHLVGAYKDHSL